MRVLRCVSQSNLCLRHHRILRRPQWNSSRCTSRLVARYGVLSERSLHPSTKQRGGLPTWSSCHVRAAASASSVEAPSADVPAEAYGFKLLRREFVKEYKSDVAIYEHEKSGAHLMSVMNDDENKTFSAAYRTPVSNDKGVPHILEHSVLAGSRKYPLKEPFLELIKGSLHTFINAMTYPDRTLYPVASCNLQDFYNLVDVYLDAVLHPSCLKDRKIFEQEGWHHNLESTGDEISFRGVVFNEMKGAYSSADSRSYTVAIKNIFPDNHLQYDSGGDPEAIPDLTYEEFKAFHDSYYHPSNGKYFFYGNDPPLERLKLLAGYLDEFEKKSVDSKVDVQPMLKEPRTVVETYAAGDQDDKCFVTLNWLLSEEPFQSEDEMAMGFLDFLLTGTQAAPMYKALTDSGLGESVTGLGIEDSLNQPFFGIGLKGVKGEDAEKVETVIIDEFKRLAKEGFSESAIEAAFNSIEFSLRENNTGSYPRGLSFWTNIMARWNYDRDPLHGIKWEAPLEQLKKRLASGEDVFGPLIQKYILDNPHKVAVRLEPDKSRSAKLAQVEETRLRSFQESLTSESLSNIVENTKALKKKQETNDSPEALKTIPSLKLSDIPKEISAIPCAIDQEAGATFLSHDLFTSDILYLEMVLDLRTVPERLIPLLPLFCESLTQLGTKEEDFVQLTERIGRKTGSLSFYPFISSQEGSRDPVAKLFVAGKATKDKVGDMAVLMRDVLTTVEFDNPERFKQLILETVSGLESRIASAGNRFASCRLAAQFSPAGYANELMGGYSYLEFVRGLVDRVTNDWSGVLKDLTELHTILLNRKDAIINMTGDEATLMSSRPYVIGLLDSLPSRDDPLCSWSTLLPKRNEALTLPTQVNYVGKTVNLFNTGSFQYSGSLEVMSNYVNTRWLWEKVRVVSGAYGCGMSLDRLSGNLGFTSYRDPNIASTLGFYDGTGDFLRKVELDEDNLTKTIIGTMSDIDRHQLPDAKGMTSLTRYLLGITDERRQLTRDQVLSTSVKDFHSMAEYFDQIKGDCSSVVAVTSPEASKELLEKTPGFWEVTNVL